ncbi:MAG: putative Ig domain-containing protein, partial [Spirulinaceae cyanobacterium]
QTYSYDLKAFDPEGQPLTYSLDPTSVSLGMTIDEYGRLRWSPSNADIGNHNVTVTATDPLGATDQRTYNLTVTADTEAPKAKLLISDVYVVEDELQGDINQQIRLQVLATDNIGVTGLQLLINNQPVAIDSNGLATITLDQLGTTTAKVVAYDGAGNVGITTDEVLVLDPANNDPPVVSLALTENEITAPIDIVGTVSDGNNDLNYYTLEVAPADGSAPFVEMSRGSSEIDNGVLGEFDPTVLANGSYILKLTAYDSAGNFSATEEVVDVSGNLKLGNFTLSFTDMQIPVSGIPISVTRTYDSLNANYSDEFGYGWRLEFRDTNLQTSLGKDEVYDEIGVATKGFQRGDKVYITLPGGKRETFTFEPIPDEEALIYGRPKFFKPAFTSESGSTVTLSVPDGYSNYVIEDPYGVYKGTNAVPYNPANPVFGGVYTLTTKGGIVYDVDARTGDLLTATDTNDNKLTFSDDGIKSDTGVSVTFERDAEGRIVKAIDPDGKEVKYDYDDEGDLVAVTDREKNVTKLKYEEETRPHFLTEVVDPLNRSAVRSEYDEKGRLKRILDVDGDPIEFVYDPNNPIQEVKDALGNPTFYQYDNRGNVTRQFNALGHETTLIYDDDNNLLQATDPNGNIIKYTYDNDRNVLSRSELHDPSETDPAISRYTYNKYGQTTSVTLPTGSTFKMEYDRNGNQTAIKDGEGNLKTMTDSEGTSTFTYDDSGRETQADYGDGLIVEYDYEGAGGDWTTIESPTTGKIERKFTEDGKLGGWVT